jgi:hypothetical protein
MAIGCCAQVSRPRADPDPDRRSPAGVIGVDRSLVGDVTGELTLAARH